MCFYAIIKICKSHSIATLYFNFEDILSQSGHFLSADFHFMTIYI